MSHSLRQLFALQIGLFGTWAPCALAAGSDVASGVDAICNGFVDSGKSPGVSVAVLVKGEVVFARGYGFANLEDEVRVDARSLFRIGSVTKQFTAAAIMKLVEAGKLGIDDLAADRVPQFEFQGKGVTIEQLLHHTSGIPNYTDLGAEWMKTIRNDYSPVDLVNTLVKGKKYDFEPGTKWAYDNTGYVLLGIAIENASGKGYYEFLQSEVLAGKGVDSIQFGSDDVVIPHRAQGYARDEKSGKGWRNDEMASMTHPYAAGALIANASDLVRWTWLLAHGKIVAEKSYQYMTTSGRTSDGKETRYGCGLAMSTFEGEPKVAHNGGIFGFTTSLSYYPNAETAVAVLLNTDGADSDSLEAQVARVALGKKPVELKDLPIEEDDFDRLTGRYVGPLKATIRRKGDQLFLQADGQGEIRLMNQGEGVFRANAPEIVLTFAAGGEVAPGFKLTQSGIEMAFERKAD